MSNARFSVFLAVVFVFGHSASYAQLGKIEAPGNAAVFDPNGDGFVSLTASGFNLGAGNTVDQFEIPMFGLPIAGEGDVVGDARGPSCSNTDLTPDDAGYSAYAVLKNGNLIFRFRVANHAQNVPGYSVLIDTDGRLGPSDPDYVAGSRNPGFEIDITLIKGPSDNAHGVRVYNIDGGNNNCSAIRSYPVSVNHQRAIGDMLSCNQYAYFYDFYVPFADLEAEFGLTTDTEIRFVALTNINATCAMSGTISDVGGVNDADYANLFDALMASSDSQCPTSLGSLSEGGGGFLEGATENPTFDEPIREGDKTITGTAQPTASVTIKLYQSQASTLLLDTKQAVADANGIWSIEFNDPLVGGMVLSAVAQLPGTCGSDSNSADPNNEIVLVEVVVVTNYAPILTKGFAQASYTENAAPVAVDPGMDISYPAEANYPTDAKIIVDATVAIAANYVNGQDFLHFVNQSGISGAFDASTGILTLTSSSEKVSLTTYEAALRSITFSNSSENPNPATRAVRFIIDDGYPTGASNAETVDVVVVPINDAPVVNGDQPHRVTYPGSGSSLTINSTITLSDSDNAQLQGAEIRIMNTPLPNGANELLQFSTIHGITATYTNGLLTLTGTATVANYQAALRNVAYVNNASPVDPVARQMSFRVSDGVVWSAIYNNSFVNFAGFNNPPIVQDENDNTVTELFFETNEDTPLKICPAIKDPDGDVVRIDSFSSPTASNQGTVARHSDDNLCLVYTPNPNVNGDDQFTVTICDQPGNCVDIIINVKNKPVNDAPTVVAKTVSVDEKTTTSISFSVTDPDGDENELSSASSTNATVAITGNFVFNYTPNKDFIGTDNVTVKVTDKKNPNVFGEGTITVNVLDKPEEPIILGDNSVPGGDVNVTTVKNKAVDFCFTAYDPDKGDLVTFQSITRKSDDAGTAKYLPALSGSPSNSRPFCFSFAPESDFIGLSEWVITICDDSDPSNPKCSSTTVRIKVEQFNYPPEILIKGSTKLTVEVPEKVTTSICVEVKDIENDEHLITSATSLSGIGTVVPGGNSGLCFNYTPPAGFIGEDKVEIIVCDKNDKAVCTTATISVIVFDVNEPPVLLVNGLPVETLMLTTSEDTPVDFCFEAIDPEGDNVLFKTGINVSGGGSLVKTGASNFCFTFTPGAEFSGTSIWNIEICDDANPSLCGAIQAIIEVTPVNDPPVVQNKTVQVFQNVTTPICIEVTDIENNVHKFVRGLSKSAIGSVEDGVADDLCFDYTPPDGFLGQDEVEVTICDFNDNAVCSTGIITVNVMETNYPPIKLINGVPTDTLRLTTEEDVPLNFCFDATDPNGDNIVVSTLTNLLGGGQLEESGEGEFCFFYTPHLDYFGLAVWEIQVCDDAELPLCAPLIVIVEITPVNDAPVAQRDSVKVMRSQKVTLNVLENAWDVEGDEILIETSPVIGPRNGEATIFSDGNITYRSSRTFRGIDSLVYQIYDTGEPSASGTGVAVFVVEDLPFTVYQTISPNGDGINDYWHIEGIDFYTDNFIRIFDRFSNVVFEMSGYDNAGRVWVGQANKGMGNNQLADGTYYYSISLGPGQDTYSGFIVLKLN